jgi:nucleoside-diphosphate-sugar epimerase
MVAKEFGIQPKYRILTRPMLKLAGLFDTTVRESYEMLYQSEYEYLFDSTKFAKAFNFQPTSYAEGIRITAAAYKKKLV